MPANPSIAGQPAEYITLQLAHFKSGLRVNPDHAGDGGDAAAGRDESASASITPSKNRRGRRRRMRRSSPRGKSSFAAATPPPASPRAPHATRRTARASRRTIRGSPGQHADYTYAQLKAFKAGERGADKEGKDANGTIMVTVAGRMTDAQMKAVAEYTSGLR